MRRNNFFCGNAEVSIKYCSYNLPYEKVGKNEPVCIADEVPFDIPERWEWVRLGSVCQIARGGSPRPIKQFLTNDEDGINWIKISDSDKGGKYISSTKEKIHPGRGFQKPNGSCWGFSTHKLNELWPPIHFEH